jgi:hypothetical protein
MQKIAPLRAVDTERRRSPVIAGRAGRQGGAQSVERPLPVHRGVSGRWAGVGGGGDALGDE